MSQTVILEKLIAYLKIKTKRLQAEIEKQAAPDKEEQLKKLQHYIAAMEKALDDGHCFGLALSEAVLSHYGYGEWWREVLVRIANWNEADEAALDQLVDLSSFLPASHKLTDDDAKTPKTFAHLLERVLHYTMYQQTSIPEEAIPDLDVSQHNMLQPQQLFEFVINDEIKKIESRDCLSGCFIESRLKTLFEKTHAKTTDEIDELNVLLEKSKLKILLEHNKQLISDNICVIHTGKHLVNLKYKHNKWEIYNPNYSHLKKDKMIKQFDTTYALLSALNGISKFQSLSVDVFSLEPSIDGVRKPISLSFDGFETRDLIDSMQSGGVYLMARFSPKMLTKIVEGLESQPGYIPDFIRALETVSEVSNESGLKSLFAYCYQIDEKVFSYIIKLAANNVLFQRSLANALVATNNSWPGLMRLTHNHSTALAELFGLAAHSHTLAHAIAQAIPIKNKRSTTTLFQLVCIQTSLPPTLQALIDEYVDVKFALRTAYKIDNDHAQFKQHVQKHIAQLSSLLDTVSDIGKIKRILCSEQYWAQYTYSLSKSFPTTVAELQHCFSKYREASKTKLLLELKAVVKSSVIYKEQHPILYAITNGIRSDKATTLYKVLYDLPGNKNNAQARLHALYEEVVAFENALSCTQKKALA